MEYGHLLAVNVVNVIVSRLLIEPLKRVHAWIVLSFQFLAILLIAFAVVIALPLDETVVGEISDVDNFNPEDPQQFFKLKKFKKLFLG